jgi:hypothetical protein
VTRSQMKWLTRLVKQGRQEGLFGHSSFAKATWRRVMESLVKLGYATPYVHGGFEATPAGHEAHRALIADVEAKSAAALAKGRALEERGDKGKAERAFATSERALELANDLRGWGPG